MTRIVLGRRLASVHVETLAKDGVRLVTLDLDKILAEHKSWQVYQQADSLVEQLREHGITPVIATNEHSVERLDVIGKTLRGIPIMYRGLDGMRGKPFPDMLLAARKYEPAGKAVHIDDQLKAYTSARLAGFDTFIWVYPKGNPFRQNPGVMLARLIELPLVAIIWVMIKIWPPRVKKPKKP